jgi:hypothetical protein
MAGGLSASGTVDVDEAATALDVIDFCLRDERMIGNVVDGLVPGEDEHEACFDRDWTDGLPVVPPTQVRVHRMLQGTRRDPNELLGRMPPDYEPCTVEKVAINAVMAGCRPEYMPVVIAAVEAALAEPFTLHGVVATTMFVGPIIIVNGPIRKRRHELPASTRSARSSRANSTIGRALQLVAFAMSAAASPAASTARPLERRARLALLRRERRTRAGSRSRSSAALPRGSRGDAVRRVRRTRRG